MLSVTSPARSEFQLPSSIVSEYRHANQLEIDNLTTRNPMIWWLWVESNHQPRAYETLALSV